MNDIYYSGHLSNGVIFCYGMLLLWRRFPKSKFMRAAYFIWIFFRLPYLFTIMTILRTHYFMDDITAFGCGFVFALLAEKVSFITDVLILGLRAQDRDLYFNKACPACGWSNWRPLRYID